MNQLNMGALRAFVVVLTIVGASKIAGLPSVAHAQKGAAQIIVVSKPSPPVVPSDPLQGLIFSVPMDMSASSVTFNTLGNAESMGELTGGAVEETGVPQSLEYLRLDTAGDAYITFDDGPSEVAPGGLMVVEDFMNRAAFDRSRDRLITGEAAGLVEPKDLVVAADLGVVIVADFAETQVAVFDLQANGNAAPRFVTSELGMTSAGEPRRPWGLAFDAAADRLFVGGTDGTVLVFDDYLINAGEGGPDRVITPYLGGEQASANTHDLVYAPDEDLLIATDVGAATTADQAGFDMDGKVFLIDNASAADGETEVKAQLTGPSTMLGNPVGAAFDGTDLFITEKTRDSVLRFANVLSLSGVVDAPPTGAVTVAKPEAVALVPKRTSEQASKVE